MLDDLLRPNLLVVFCGTAAGARSAELKQYYAGRGNQFWSTLAATKLTPRQLDPSEYRLLPEFGIGLTDIAKNRSGNDGEIRFRHSDRQRLRDVISKYQPRYLCFNGKRAACEYLGTRSIQYGVQAEKIEATTLFVAPSTSAAAGAAWDLKIWMDLAKRVRS
ncbi:MAG: mismatch-specific DNA-glycosylase [Gemmatimonadetes bacterium]|nr:mismatch-specific DNA-glycosylase [Gemmatimonadota bacterium]